MISLILYFIIFILIFLHRIKTSGLPFGIRRLPRLPSGPTTGLPFLGFLYHFAFAKNYSLKLIEMKSRWGKMCTVQMGSYNCVWLNDSTLIREAWSNPVFCGRPKMDGITSRTNTNGVSGSAAGAAGGGGLIFNEGPDLQEQRRFTLKTLRNLGFNRNTMECLIQEEADELVANLRACGPVPVSTRHRFNIASINALWRIVTGEKLDSDCPEMCRLVEALDRNMELSAGTKLAFFMPWLTRLCPNLIGWTQYVRDANEIFNFWRDYAKKRLERYETNDEDDDDTDKETTFVDIYIQEMKSSYKNPDLSNLFFQNHNEETTRLALVLQDLFIAGTETTATTLRWALLYLASYQSVQEKLYAEICTIVGGKIAKDDNGNNVPSLADRSKMIYTQAFIQEVLRHATLAPLGMLHSAMEDVLFHGYLIPAGTIIQANICGAHRDPEYWGNDPSPDQFEPERFIVTKGKSEGGGGTTDCTDVEMSLNLKNIGFLAFSHGKRMCLGETLARDELFIFITRIVQEFQIDLDYSKGTMSDFNLEPIIGVSAIPKPHKLIFRKRERTKPYWIGFNHVNKS